MNNTETDNKGVEYDYHSGDERIRQEACLGL